MLHAAGVEGVGHRALTPAVCACAHTSVAFASAHDPRPLRAVEAAEAWARGRATDEEVIAAAMAASEAASAIPAPLFPEAFSAAIAATNAAFYATSGVPATAVSVASFAANAGREMMARLLLDMADLVRTSTPTVIVLRAAAAP